MENAEEDKLNSKKGNNKILRKENIEVEENELTNEEENENKESPEEITFNMEESDFENILLELSKSYESNLEKIDNSHKEEIQVFTEYWDSILSEHEETAKMLSIALEKKFNDEKRKKIDEFNKKVKIVPKAKSELINLQKTLNYLIKQNRNSEAEFIATKIKKTIKLYETQEQDMYKEKFQSFIKNMEEAQSQEKKSLRQRLMASLKGKESEKSKSTELLFNGFQNKRKEFVLTYKKFLEKLVKFYQNRRFSSLFEEIKKYYALLQDKYGLTFEAQSEDNNDENAIPESKNESVSEQKYQNDEFRELDEVEEENQQAFIKSKNSNEKSNSQKGEKERDHREKARGKYLNPEEEEEEEEEVKENGIKIGNENENENENLNMNMNKNKNNFDNENRDENENEYEEKNEHENEEAINLSSDKEKDDRGIFKISDFKKSESFNNSEKRKCKVDLFGDEIPSSNSDYDE